jgi:hypothetical protein
MKLIHQSYVKNGAGEVKVVAEEGEVAATLMAELVGTLFSTCLATAKGHFSGCSRHELAQIVMNTGAARQCAAAAAAAMPLPC